MWQANSARKGIGSIADETIVKATRALSTAKLYYPLKTAPRERVIAAHLKHSIDTRRAIALSILALLSWASTTALQILFLLKLMVLPIVRWHAPGGAIVVWLGITRMAPMTMACPGSACPPLRAEPL
jgi:hypothetical protein